ncbi:response regulator [Devosia naphthalenivorans]|uniref:response regulator n=1 Tax=Devosia naphthalenivorans TaxID=2082392 RepID=UPI000D34FC27|nr:response regulator [Devosia naphthalenivorans]
MDKSEITVLVVEDEPLVLMSTADFLQDEGFTVLEAATADEAIVLLENNPQISILFTDVDMPGTMDGLKLSAAVRNRWPPVRIVVTSGHRIVDITELPDGGVFFSKPYRHHEIAASFRELMSGA